MVNELWSGLDIINASKFTQAIENISSSRSDMYKKLFDPRRDIYEECGYPKGWVDPQVYKDLYDRNSIAARVVEIMAKECWQKQPVVREDIDSTEETQFELEWSELGASLNNQSWFRSEDVNPIWSLLLRADILSGIGRYGVIFLGLDDGKPLHTPADTLKEVGSIFKVEKDNSGNPLVTPDILGIQPTTLNEGVIYNLTVNAEAPKRKLLYMRAFPETQARVVAVEGNRTSPRYGMPLMYSITIQDQANGIVAESTNVSTINIHWTRVIHIVDNYHQATSSQVVGAPRMRPVLNHILALEKVYGGSGEGYWSSSIPKTIIETHPSLGGDVVIDKQDTRDQLENMHNSMQKYLILMGMSAKTLPPAMVDPTPYIAAHIEAICVKIPVSIRIFKGSERGDLASSQDDGQHNDNIRGRNGNHTIPNIVAAFIDRLILLKVLTKPQKNYSIEWPDLETQSARDKANITLIRSQAMAQYVSQNLMSLMSPCDFLCKELGYSHEEAELILENAEEYQQEKMDEAQQVADEYGMVPGAPDGFEKPKPQTPIKVKPGEKLVNPPNYVKQPPGKKGGNGVSDK